MATDPFHDPASKAQIQADVPDESDRYATYRDDKPATKFFRTSDDVKLFLRANDGYGERNDLCWRGGIPIHASDYPLGPKCDWRRIERFLSEEKIQEYRQPEHDSAWDESLEKTKKRLRVKIGVTLDGLDPLPTCFIRDFATIETDAIHRLGHQYEDLQIEEKDVPRQLYAFIEDLLSSYKCRFPAASGAAIADFVTSLNVRRHLEKYADRMKTDFSISDVDDALEFVLRRVAGLAHEIRTEAQMQSSDVGNPDGQNAGREAQGSKENSKATQPVRRNQKYKLIDEALRKIAESLPRTQEEVFQSLEGRHVVIPPAEPFMTARGWTTGFRRDAAAARAWLSKRWAELNLPPLPRGPKNPKK